MHFLYSRAEVDARIVRAIVAAASVGMILGFVLGWFTCGAWE